MKLVRINRRRLSTSQGHKMFGEEITISDAELAKLTTRRQNALVVIGDAPKPVEKQKRKTYSNDKTS